MPGLLYPAYQKLYSALANLERFDKEADFFNNISCLDNFFSEYRNITFVLQSQLAHTDYSQIYQKNRDKYLVDHWFVEKRNETTKQQPFRLVKKIKLTVYLPYQELFTLEQEFTVEDDVALESLFPELKALLSSIKEVEVFFSVSFSFTEHDNNIDVFDKLFTGIASMQQFMEAMECDIGEDCALCREIKTKINKMKIQLVPRDFLLINDYVYYPERDKFERGKRYALVPSIDGKTVTNLRLPLSTMSEREYFNYDGTPFKNFVFMHAVLRFINHGVDIMPVFMIVYNDDTYDLKPFPFDIKTTIYRKINEVARAISTENIREIYFISLYSVCQIDQNTSRYTKERVESSSSDILVGSSIDCDLNEREYVFDGKAMEDPNYIVCVMQNGMGDSLLYSKMNLLPIIKAFKEKKNN